MDTWAPLVADQPVHTSETLVGSAAGDQNDDGLDLKPGVKTAGTCPFCAVFKPPPAHFEDRDLTWSYDKNGVCVESNE
jgi:hypothetical protein